MIELCNSIFMNRLKCRIILPNETIRIHVLLLEITNPCYEQFLEESQELHCIYKIQNSRQVDKMEYVHSTDIENLTVY